MGGLFSRKPVPKHDNDQEEKVRLNTSLNKRYPGQFSHAGLDDENEVIACCNFCGLNGVLVRERVNQCKGQITEAPIKPDRLYDYTNEHGVHQGYIQLANAKKLAKPSKGTTWSDVPKEYSIRVTPAIEDYLKDIPVFDIPDDDDTIPYYNPNNMESDWVCATNAGEYYINTQSYDYPRYITRLIGKVQESKKINEDFFDSLDKLTEPVNEKKFDFLGFFPHDSNGDRDKSCAKLLKGMGFNIKVVGNLLYVNKLESERAEDVLRNKGIELEDNPAVDMHKPGTWMYKQMHR